LKTLLTEGGLFASLLAGRRGRGSSSPAQLGHLLLRILIAQSWQKVHSNEQILATVESGGRFLSQHSQLGLRSSISRFVPNTCADGKIWEEDRATQCYGWGVRSALITVSV